MTLPLKVILTIPLECCHARRSRHLVSVKIENLLIILSFFFVTFWIWSLVSEIFQNFEKSLLQLRNPIYSTPNLLFPGHNISPRDSPMPAKYFLKVHKGWIIIGQIWWLSNLKMCKQMIHERDWVCWVHFVLHFRADPARKSAPISNLVRDR